MLKNESIKPVALSVVELCLTGDIRVENSATLLFWKLVGQSKCIFKLGHACQTSYHIEISGAGF